jgi:ribA/ribD-fused uncharacterized protein
MYHVYLLQSEKRTYIGMTDDPLRRLRQHNREIAGGARATAGRKWKHVCVLSGFPTRRSALQCEWMWKHMSRMLRRASVIGKMETIAQIWKRDYSSSTSIHFSQFSTPFFLSFSPHWTETLKKIESIQSLRLVRCAARFQTDYDSFQLFPFPLISKMSSPISNVVVVAAEEEKKKAPRKPKTAAPEAEAAAAAAPAEKPKKEKKAAAPASDGEGAPVEKKARKPKTAAAAAAATEEPVAAAAAAAAPAPEPAEAPKEAKPKKVKKAAATPVPAVEEGMAALPGSTAALAAGGAGLNLARADAVTTDAETTDAEGAAPKEKKPRKPRAKKAPAAAAADLPLLDAATLDALDMAGKVALLKDHVLALTQQVAALKTARDAASSDDESATGGKKQRKKREPKAKAVCPAAADGVIRFHTTLKNDYKALSNSHKADITIDGVVYPTVEHYYQCAKFLDTAPEYADKIRATANAALIKNMGRTKKVEIRADWEAVEVDVMRKALQAKFAQHADLAALLRGTGAARLEEESPSDAHWGIGADGAGKNLLGTLLADVRTSL